MYKKNKHVFWVQTDTGIVLQNINSNHFIELNKIQEKVWEYLDGTFSNKAILTELTKHFADMSKAELVDTIKTTFAILLDFDLISEN